MIHTAITVLSFLAVPHEDAKALAFFFTKRLQATASLQRPASVKG